MIYFSWSKAAGISSLCSIVSHRSLVDVVCQDVAVASVREGVTIGLVKVAGTSTVASTVKLKVAFIGALCASNLVPAGNQLFSFMVAPTIDWESIQHVAQKLACAGIIGIIPAVRNL